MNKSGRLSIHQVAHPKREGRDAVENGLRASQIARQIELVHQAGSKSHCRHCVEGVGLLPNFDGIQYNFALLYGVSFITRHNLPSTLKIIGRHH
jgi:hypothetical protein